MGTHSPQTPCPISSSGMRRCWGDPNSTMAPSCQQQGQGCRAGCACRPQDSLRFLVGRRSVSPQCPGLGTAEAHAHGGRAWRLERRTVPCYPLIIRQGVLLSLALPFCLKELISVCSQGESLSQTI